MIATNRIKAVIGTGITGLSVARFLAQQQKAFVLLDTRTCPPNIEKIKAEFPEIQLELGELNVDTLLSCEEIIVSPGISVETPAIAAAKAANIPVVGDIELFVRYAKAPIVAITGSNAKSTVTTLVGEMASKAGIKVAVGGNLGTPALELLADDIELYVMELSSFQLETVTKLNAKVATILNISADHLDRYPDMRAYILAKLRVYFGAENIVVNRNDVLTHPPLAANVKPIYFGGKADFGSFGLIEEDGETFLAKNLKPLLSSRELKISGKHNLDNALAALALGDAAGIPITAMVETLKEFRGLHHRCEYVATKNGVDFYNDSKGTNIGATVAAINGLARSPAQLIVIAGGEGKGQDFSELKPALAKNTCRLVLIGRDAPVIADAIKDVAQYEFADSMQDAIHKSFARANSGDAVLLSPACASFDMFKNYEDRGEQFCVGVLALQEKEPVKS
ncbi:UDP-N-acetylmuramoylalanine--D-glutamate ligase [Cellvibrio zantedeschiae]|uniref:UDP-N-acetylmuramoylalanine--D-glutamate ligase n=1 Tax=Cellvibrio zantedeschiae TaxID=1237077 RepID=A0ABQ3ASI0_9GAMM|nr:UDP-N-acetylmuramoyl-L-alanine--D-glutamate ligase [Cellvibrio zantedeschiae]GGY62756.1 UDP-N-acetylmuramoylalanine--D-glutamate ligase [Cellvibrio zantedeschiae]